MSVIRDPWETRKTTIALLHDCQYLSHFEPAKYYVQIRRSFNIPPRASRAFHFPKPTKEQEYISRADTRSL
jgi:hypothetical protein